MVTNKKRFWVYVYTTFSYSLTGWYKIGSHYGFNADFRINQQDNTSNPEILEPKHRLDVTNLVNKIAGKGASLEDKKRVLIKLEQEIRDFIIHNLNYREREDKKREWVKTYGLKPIFTAIDAIHIQYNVKRKRPIVLKPEGKYLWQDLEVVTPALNHFSTHSRGNSIVYCGGGKTMMSYWVIRKLEKKHNLVIIALPNLGLVSQTKEEIRQQQNALGKGFEYLCICSDKNSGRLYENTTDVNNIEKWLDVTKDNDDLRVIFTTYQSGPILSGVIKELNQGIDMIVFDESHRATGRRGGLFTYMLEDDNIKADKRWFITATPKFNRTNRPDAFGFDNEEIYGKNITSINYRTLLKYNMVTPYKLYGLGVSRDEIKAFINENVWVKFSDIDEETQSRFIASLIALNSAYKKGKVTRVISYHSRNAYAERFENAIIKLKDNPKFSGFKGLKVYRCEGGQTKKNRQMLDAAAKDNKALICNSRVLTEGINVPAIDGIIFVDPRRSLVDINQAIGRVVRLFKGKDYGRVILPAVMNNEGDFENETYDYLSAALHFVSEMDEQLKAAISYRKVQGPKPSPITQPTPKVDSIELDIDFVDVDLNEFLENIIVKAANWKNKNRNFTNEELIEMFSECNNRKQCYRLDVSAAMTYENRELMELRWPITHTHIRKPDSYFVELFQDCKNVKEARAKARKNGNPNDYNIARKRGIIESLGLNIKTFNSSAYDEKYLVNILKQNPGKMTMKILSKLVNPSFCQWVRNNEFDIKYTIGSDKDREINQYDKQGNFIKTFRGSRFIRQELGISTTDISSCCKGKQKTSRGFIWRYADEDNFNLK